MEPCSHVTPNGSLLPPNTKGANNMGHKPSGYLKVKGEIEHAAITAVKKQLGKHYREDGPLLSVEFDTIPPEAFECQIADLANGRLYSMYSVIRFFQGSLGLQMLWVEGILLVTSGQESS